MIGIYKITNHKGMVYIGQSSNIEYRFKTYKREFGIGQPKLFNSFKKYRSKAHSFETITECEVDELNEKERATNYMKLKKDFNLKQ